MRPLQRPVPRLVTVSVLPRLSLRSLSLAYTLHEPRRNADSQQKPIIIMHGLFGSKRNNQTISKTFARDLKAPVYAIDLRNHGDSPHDPVHDYQSMATDVEEFMDRHNLRKPTLIGHSMGAKVAMTLALRSPAAVGALVPVDNAPVDAVLHSDFGKYVQGMRKIMEAQVTKHAEADAILQDFEEVTSGTSPGAVASSLTRQATQSLAIRQFLLTNLVRGQEAGSLKFRIPVPTLAAALDSMGDFPYRDPAEARYDGPTLFVRGTKSHYVADDVLPLVGRFFPMFELRNIDCGHWVISERPQAFRKAVVEFLQQKY